MMNHDDSNSQNLERHSPWEPDMNKVSMEVGKSDQYKSMPSKVSIVGPLHTLHTLHQVQARHNMSQRFPISTLGLLWTRARIALMANYKQGSGNIELSTSRITLSHCEKSFRRTDGRPASRITTSFLVSTVLHVYNGLEPFSAAQHPLHQVLIVLEFSPGK